MNEPMASHAADALAPHRELLARHLTQCRQAGLWLVQGLEAAHCALSRRFATSVLATTVLLLLPALWL
jgi:hypothetical protein